MMRAGRIAIIFLVTVTHIGCSYKLVQKGQLNEPLVEDIRVKVSELRGLPFRNSVEIEIISQADAGEYFREEFKKEYPPEKIALLQRAYVRMGLINADMDIAAMVLDFYAENVAGFYDPKRKKLFLVEESVDKFSIMAFILQRDLNAEMILAHEFTHALDDQHFDLVAMEESFSDNDDAVLALQALEEGTATLVGLAVIYHPGLTMQDVINVLGSYERLTDSLIRYTAGDTPTIFIDAMIFAYIGGAGFISRLYELSNGWDEINKAYSQTPRSSEEILHPEKFIDGNDPPVKIHLGVDPRLFGDDWIILERNTFGELGISSLLRRFMEYDKAKAIARGWGGDRYAIVGSPDGADTLWIWVTEWDSDQDAADFHSAYMSLLEKKYDGIREIKCSGIEGRCFENADGELIWINIVGKSNGRGARVSIIEGADAKTLPTAVKYTAPSLIAGRPPEESCHRKNIPAAIMQAP